MKLYLAGPMTGIKDYNRDAFMAAAKVLRARGFEVFNPAEQELSVLIQHDEVTNEQAYRQCLALDLDYICREAEAIAFLPGWEKSQGSMAEFFAAKACGLQMIYLRENACVITAELMSKGRGSQQEPRKGYARSGRQV